MAVANIQRRPAGKPAQPVALAKPILHLNDERLDFKRSVPLRKSYVVASSYRCGSTFLCTELWRTGLLGAPWEYFNSRKGPKTLSIQEATMTRLKATSVEDYVAKLIARRTSKNGVFGLKAHFHDFESALKSYPEMLEVLAPVTYIFIDRRDKLAQAVSMARAMQTKSWISLAKPDLTKLRYDRDLISQSLGKSEMQRLGWQRWFEARDINPIAVYYEDMMANPAAVVRNIVDYLGVQNDEPNIIRLPPVKKQGDDTNKQWVARFEREVQSGVMTNEQARAAELLQKDADESRAHEPDSAEAAKAAAHFFDRYDVFTGGEQPRRQRLQHRYEAIIGRSRPLLKDATVLHIGSGDGVWCMAALDAGASRAVGVEPRQQVAEAAKATLAKLGADAKSYQFVAKQVFAALQEFKPGEFDVIICAGFFEQADPRYFFDQLRRLRPKRVILDTTVMPGANPAIRFSLKEGAEAVSQQALPSASILATPSYELIAFLCDVYGFRWEVVDLKALGVTDWEGIRDYESGRRRTYLLDFAS